MTLGTHHESLNPDRDESGYLLLETLVASALLLFAFLAIMPLFTMASKQNAVAKDVSVASAMALEKAEEFRRMTCTNIRRGTCCKELNVTTTSMTAGACGTDEVTVDGIRYKRECVVKQNVASSRYSDDNDGSDYTLSYQGMVSIYVTVTPQRVSTLSKRSAKPARTALLRVCDPDQ